MPISKHDLVKEAHNILSEWDNDDENLLNLENAMEFFCGTWDKSEGMKHAILETLEDQYNNHTSDLTEEELKKLINILNAKN